MYFDPEFTSLEYTNKNEYACHNNSSPRKQWAIAHQKLGVVNGWVDVGETFTKSTPRRHCVDCRETQKKATYAPNEICEERVAVEHPSNLFRPRKS